MKDRESDLLERWTRERPIYEAWGNYVCETIKEAVTKNIKPAKPENFFKIPPTYRTKDPSSLLAKAFHRSKSQKYTNPYEDIEDKVGVRIVVLFSEEIRLVEAAILECDLWMGEKARDYIEERTMRPFEFDYQSLHYVIRSKDKIIHNGTEIASNTPCEIQIRTILQHAYSELTHDTIYKPSIQVEPEVQRAAAKSMALIEATDDYFTQVRNKLDQALAPVNKVADYAASKYVEFTSLQPKNSPLNTLIIDYYKQWATGDFEKDISEYLAQKNFLADFIRERYNSSLIYRQSGVILIYWAIHKAPRAAASGPLTNNELELMYGDLGGSLPRVAF